jgi:hypothetical protein
MLEIYCYFAHDVHKDGVISLIEINININDVNIETQSLRLTRADERLYRAELTLPPDLNTSESHAKTIIYAQVKVEVDQRAAINEREIHQLFWSSDRHSSRYWVIIARETFSGQRFEKLSPKDKDDGWLYSIMIYFATLFWATSQSDDDFIQHLKSIHWGNSEKYLKKLERGFTLKLLSGKVSGEINTWTGFKRWLMVNHYFLQTQDLSWNSSYPFDSQDKTDLMTFTPLAFIDDALASYDESLMEALILPFVEDLIGLKWAECIPWAFFILSLPRIPYVESMDPLIENLFEEHTSSLLSFCEAWRAARPDVPCPLPQCYLPHIRAILQTLPQILVAPLPNEIHIAVGQITARQSYLPSLKEEGGSAIREEIQALLSLIELDPSLWEIVKNNAIFQVCQLPSDLSIEELFRVLILPTIHFACIPLDFSLSQLDSLLLKIQGKGAAEVVRTVYQCLRHLSHCNDVSGTGKGVQLMGPLHRVVTGFTLGDQMKERLELYLTEDCPTILQMESEALSTTMKTFSTESLREVTVLLNSFLATPSKDNLHLASLLFDSWKQSFEIEISLANTETIRSVFLHRPGSHDCLPLLVSPSVMKLYQLFLEELEKYPKALLEHEGLSQLKRKSDETRTWVTTLACDLLHGKVTWDELGVANIKTVPIALRECSSIPFSDDDLSRVIEKARAMRQQWEVFQRQLLAIVDVFTPNEDSLKGLFVQEIEVHLARSVCDWSLPQNIEPIVKKMKSLQSLFFVSIKENQSTPSHDSYDLYLKSIETMISAVESLLEKFVDGSLDLATALRIFHMQIAVDQCDIKAVVDEEVRCLGDEKFRQPIEHTLLAISTAPQLRDLLILSRSEVCQEPPLSDDPLFAFVKLFFDTKPQEVLLSTLWSCFTNIQMAHPCVLDPLHHAAKVCRQLFEEENFLDLMKTDRTLLYRSLSTTDPLQCSFLDTYILLHKEGGLCATPSPKNITEICRSLKSLSNLFPLEQMVGRIATIGQILLPAGSGDEEKRSSLDVGVFKGLLDEQTEVLTTRLTDTMKTFGTELEDRLDSDQQLLRQIENNLEAIMNGIDCPLIFQLTPSAPQPSDSMFAKFKSAISSRTSETYELSFLCYSCEAKGHVYSITIIDERILQALDGLAAVIKVLRIGGRLCGIPIPHFDDLIADSLKIAHISQGAVPILTRSMRLTEKGSSQLSNKLPQVKAHHLEPHRQDHSEVNQLKHLTLDHQRQVKTLLHLARDEKGDQTGLTRFNKGEKFIVWLCEECAERERMQSNC